MDKDILLVAGILGATVVILDAVFLWIIVANQRKADVVKTWPSVTGTVMTSYLESKRASDNSGFVNYPIVNYSYQVGGGGYQGSRIAPGLEVGGTGAEKVIARYPAGAQVAVFYNPQNPSDAVLEAKAPAQWVMWLVLVIVDVTLCGMAGLFMFNS